MRQVHDVASGLKYLHENDIVHEDLKPVRLLRTPPLTVLISYKQNILIDKREVACLCDFGISQIINREGVTTRSTASSTYIAPELLILVHPLTSNPIYPKPTHKSDVYSFGLLSLEVGTFFPNRRSPLKCRCRSSPRDLPKGEAINRSMKQNFWRASGRRDLNMMSRKSLQECGPCLINAGIPILDCD
jgi:serine/threonine protein kinase